MVMSKASKVFADRLDALLPHGEPGQVAAVVGVSPATISRYRTGERQPDLDTLVALSKYFHKSVDYLLGVIDVDSEPHSAIIPRGADFLEHISIEAVCTSSAILVGRTGFVGVPVVSTPETATRQTLTDDDLEGIMLLRAHTLARLIHGRLTYGRMVALELHGEWGVDQVRVMGSPLSSNATVVLDRGGEDPETKVVWPGSMYLMQLPGRLAIRHLWNLDGRYVYQGVIDRTPRFLLESRADPWKRLIGRVVFVAGATI